MPKITIQRRSAGAKKKPDRDKNAIQCYKCKKYGHIARNCEVKDQPNFHEEDANDGENLFVTYLAADNDAGVSSEVWHLDSGCSGHTT